MLWPEELRAGGEAVAKRSQGDRPDPSIGIYLADTLGELGLFYRLASLAFIGGSLVPHGGQNPLEAARLGCPSLFGPHTGNFDEMTAHLLQAGAAKRVENALDLTATIGALLDDPAACARMARQAWEAGAAEGAVLCRVRQALGPLLNRQLGTIEAREPDHACA